MTALLATHKDKFIISENTGIDMKVTIDAMAWLVNPNNLVKVGNQIIQYNYDNIKVITDGATNQVANLPNVKETQGNIFVGKVERSINTVSTTNNVGGRTEELSGRGFCDSKNVNSDWDWRVIAYVEEVKTYYSSYYTYQTYIKLRSFEWFSSFWSWNWSNVQMAVIAKSYLSKYLV